MRHLAYFRPFGAGMGAVTYLLVPLPMRGRQRLDTVREDGAPGHLYVHPAQVLPVTGGALHRVLLATLRQQAAEHGHAVPVDVETPAARRWCRYSRRRNRLVGARPDGTAALLAR